MTDAEDTYMAAAEIADKLLAIGLPIVKFEAFDAGRKAGFLIVDGEGLFHAFRVPRDNLNLQAVESMVRAYL